MIHKNKTLQMIREGNPDRILPISVTSCLVACDVISGIF